MWEALLGPWGVGSEPREVRHDETTAAPAPHPVGFAVACIIRRDGTGLVPRG
jgi:hypothetical protein